MSEDADYQISLWNPTAKIRADLLMRVSIPDKKRKLSIFWRVEKAQVYDQRGIQVEEKASRYTSSHPVYMPEDVIERWRATGPGWQTRMADRLAKAAPK